MNWISQFGVTGLRVYFLFVMELVDLCVQRELDMYKDKYEKAMLNNAQLENEKQTYRYVKSYTYSFSVFKGMIKLECFR